MKILSNEYLSNLPSDTRVAPGGPANFARGFSQHAVAHGHTWIGLIHQGNHGTTTSIRMKAKLHGKFYYLFSSPHDKRSGFMDSKVRLDAREWFADEIRCIRRFIRKTQPDLLFLNGYSVYAWLLLEAAKLEGLPIVIQHAGIAQVEFEQYKHLYTLAARMAVLQMERDIVHAAAKQVFLNTYSRDAFSKRVEPVPSGQAVIIPLPYHALYTHRNSARPKRPTDGQVVIGSVARWDRIKNHDAILRVAQEAKRQGLPWHFKSVTRIPETKVQQRFKRAYRETIEIVPPMPAEDLINFYHCVDLLILPSHFDVSPTVVMEAALQGRGTLISPNVGWVSEYRDCDLDDWIIDFHDAKRVVRRIGMLLKESASARFRSYIRTKHAPAKVFAAYLTLFKSVV